MGTIVYLAVKLVSLSATYPEIPSFGRNSELVCRFLTTDECHLTRERRDESDLYDLDSDRRCAKYEKCLFYCCVSGKFQK